MTHSLATPRELSLSTIPRVCIPRFLALVGSQKVFLQSTLQMLFELVLMTSPNLLGFLFFKLGGHGGEFGNCPSVGLCLARLYKSTKLEVEVGTGLICRRCGGITNLNAVAFTAGGAGNVRVILSTIKAAVNIKLSEDLL